MQPPSISLEHVRQMQLAAQGLLAEPARPAQKEDILEAIRRMGVLQIDTIHVVARSPYLVLYSRVGSYAPAWLDELLAEGRLFEYWSHAACFIPIENFALYAHSMRRDTHPWYSDDWKDHHVEAIGRVLARMREEGPLRSADFERTDGQKGGWWNWKEEKQVLEFLHTTGQVMIARREKFQRIYDLRDRVLQKSLPGWDDSRALEPEIARDALTLKAVECLGVAHPRWVHDYFRLGLRGSVERANRLADEGKLLRVKVEGWEAPGSVHPGQLPRLEQALAGELVPSKTALLSPFDPLIWDRDRLMDLFGFYYQIECYLPEAKRKYGYFSLPILHRDRLVGRLDAKARRKEGIFEIRSLHLEEGVTVDDRMIDEVSEAIRRCAVWHGTPEVTGAGVFQPS